MPKSILTFPEVAEQIGVSVPTLYRWRANGTFPQPIRLGPARVGFVATDVDAWIAARQAEAA
jgi:prophage regulatory protein